MGYLPYGSIYILRTLRPVRKEDHPVLYQWDSGMGKGSNIRIPNLGELETELMFG